MGRLSVHAPCTLTQRAAFYNGCDWTGYTTVLSLEHPLGAFVFLGSASFRPAVVQFFNQTKTPPKRSLDGAPDTLVEIL